MVVLGFAIIVMRVSMYNSLLFGVVLLLDVVDWSSLSNNGFDRSGFLNNLLNGSSLLNNGLYRSGLLNNLNVRCHDSTDNISAFDAAIIPVGNHVMGPVCVISLPCG